MFKQSIIILTINIECDLHIDNILNFINYHKPDVIFFQEIFKDHIPFFEEKLQMRSIYAGLNFLQTKNSMHEMGIAIFSHFEFSEMDLVYYRGNSLQLPILVEPKPNPIKMARALLIAKFKKIPNYRFINTHFTWSPNGTPSKEQYTDLNKLLKILKNYNEFILCGDFNAPRGTAIFDTLSLNYKDNLPADILTTLDRNLHVAGHLDLVVDGVFTTPGLDVSELKIFDGLSDHCAILAKVKPVEL